MTLKTDEFIQRFLIHALPKGFHCIRHYGLSASHVPRKNLSRLRQALALTKCLTSKPDRTDAHLRLPPQP